MIGLKEKFVIGICGQTCSGKTTLSRFLKEEFKLKGQVIEQDEHFLREECIPILSTKSGKWRNYECPDAIDWLKFTQKIRFEKKNENGEKFVIVEGFLLMENEIMHQLIDILIVLENQSNQVIYERKKSRNDEDFDFVAVDPSCFVDKIEIMKLYFEDVILVEKEKWCSYHKFAKNKLFVEKHLEKEKVKELVLNFIEKTILN